MLFEAFQGRAPRYFPNPGHLWFVWNLVVYFVFAFPLFFLLKRFPENWVLKVLQKLTPYGWIVILPGFLFLVTRVLEPQISGESFSTHFMRFWYGFGCFLSGVVLVSLGERFWQGIRRIGHVALPIALFLYLARQFEFEPGGETIQLFARTVESSCGMLAFLGYGSLCFSQASPLFSHLNRSVFAVYVVHLPVQQAVAFFLFRLDLPVTLVFVLHSVTTLGFSYLIYAYLLRPIRWLHPFFGIAPVKAASSARSREESVPSLPSGAACAGRIIILYVVTPLLVLISIGFLLGSVLTKSESESPLTEAIFSGDTESLREQLENGADVNRRGNRGWTDLSLAIFARDAGALELMLGYDPDLAVRSDDGQTLVWAAAWMSDAECTQLLLEHGAAEPLEPDDVDEIQEVLNQPYKTAAAQIRLFLPVPREDEYLENRTRIRELLREYGVLKIGS